MRNLLAASVGMAVLIVGTAAFQSPADARRGGGVHRGGGGHVHARNVNRNFSANRNINRNVTGNINRNVNINRNINRNANVNRNVHVNRNVNVNRNVARTADRNVKYVYRNGKRGFWRNGVWVLAPAAAVTYGYIGASCDYLFKEWQATGSIDARDGYYQCVNGN
jgi:hypothetical protein